MKKFLLTTAATFCLFASYGQERKTQVQPDRATPTATITETDKVKIKEDIKKRREQNRLEMEKARKAVKERISTDTVTTTR
ncbi:MAG TPA: hypothetical protein VFQ50_08980 [Flavobacterium sp.]|jgi:hypothetical protein|nr:hypothetical protein [Flavobacterium sp.]